MYNGKKVLVAGGAGFVGKNLVLRLLDMGAHVTATTFTRDGDIKHPNLRYVKVDLTLIENCQSVVRDVDFVFMCAANTSGAAVMEKTPLAHLTPNIFMNLGMLDASYAAGVKKFLFISSNTVYPVTDKPVAENDVTNEFFEKYFIVAWMKRFTEIVCEMYSEKIKDPMKVVVVRPANIYGRFDDFEWETSHVIPALIRKVVERHAPLEVWGDGMDLKEFIYIDDFIDGMLLAMKNYSGFEPLNIAAGKPSTIKEILKIIIETDGFDNANIIFNADKPSMIRKRLIDPSLAEKRINFKATTSMEEGLKDTINWYRSSVGEKMEISK